MAICACGCEEEIEFKRHHKQHPPKYKQGHWTKAHPFNKGKRTSINRILPNTICGCGCGQIVPEFKPSGHARYRRARDGNFYIPGHCPKPKGENNHNWKGGRYINSAGYVFVYHPEHPNANKDGCVLEHRYVWEQNHKRYLKPHEHIHHINGIRSDNRLGNLIMLSQSQHSKLTRKELGPIPTTPESCSKAGKLGAIARWHKPPE